jgi:hypothetical protein
MSPRSSFSHGLCVSPFACPRYPFSWSLHRGLPMGHTYRSPIPPLMSALDYPLLGPVRNSAQYPFIHVLLKAPVIWLAIFLLLHNTPLIMQLVPRDTSETDGFVAFACLAVLVGVGRIQPTVPHLLNQRPRSHFDPPGILYTPLYPRSSPAPRQTIISTSRAL